MISVKKFLHPFTGKVGKCVTLILVPALIKGENEGDRHEKEGLGCLDL